MNKIRPPKTSFQMFGIKSAISVLTQLHGVLIKRLGHWTVPLICFGISVLAHFAPLLWTKHPILYDWGYFYAQRLVERSNFLTYGRVPMHDPWVAGGMDILANPQSRVFSPLILLDLILPPYPSMIVTLILTGALGAFGMFLLFQKAGYRSYHWIFAAAAFLFSGWFGQHYAEGHFSYALFQALPLVWFSFLNFDKIWGFALMTALMVFCFLEGAIYLVFFSMAWFLSSAICGALPIRNWLVSLKKNGISYLIIACSGVCISSLKWYPVLLVHGRRYPWVDYAIFPFKSVVDFLLNPFHAPFEDVSFSIYRMHEFAAYLGLGLCILGLFSWLPRLKISVLKGQFHPRKWLSAHHEGSLFLLLLFWLWVSLGFWRSINPWSLIQKIPLLNHAHIQSRHLVFVAFILVLLVTKGIQKLNWNRYTAALLFLVLGDLWIGRQYPFYASYKMYPADPFATTLLHHTQIIRTVEDGHKPKHYLTGFGSKQTYDPAQPPTAVRASEDADYFGEVDLVDGDASVRVVEFTPGKILVEILARTPGKLVINTNWIQGWYAKSKPAIARAFPTTDQLLAVQFESTGGQPTLIELVYRPKYLPIVFGLVGFGLMLALFLLSRNQMNLASFFNRKRY